MAASASTAPGHGTTVSSLIARKIPKPFYGPSTDGFARLGTPSAGVESGILAIPPINPEDFFSKFDALTSAIPLSFENIIHLNCLFPRILFYSIKQLTSLSQEISASSDAAKKEEYLSLLKTIRKLSHHCSSVLGTLSPQVQVDEKIYRLLIVWTHQITSDLYPDAKKTLFQINKELTSLVNCYQQSLHREIPNERLMLNLSSWLQTIKKVEVLAFRAFMVTHQDFVVQFLFKELNSSLFSYDPHQSDLPHTSSFVTSVLEKLINLTKDYAEITQQTDDLSDAYVEHLIQSMDRIIRVLDPILKQSPTLSFLNDEFASLVSERPGQFSSIENLFSRFITLSKELLTSNPSDVAHHQIIFYGHRMIAFHLRELQRKPSPLIVEPLADQLDLLTMRTNSVHSSSRSGAASPEPLASSASRLIPASAIAWDSSLNSVLKQLTQRYKIFRQHSFSPDVFLPGEVDQLQLLLNAPAHVERMRPLLANLDCLSSTTAHEYQYLYLIKLYVCSLGLDTPSLADKISSLLTLELTYLQTMMRQRMINGMIVNKDQEHPLYYKDLELNTVMGILNLHPLNETILREFYGKTPPLDAEEIGRDIFKDIGQFLEVLEIYGRIDDPKSPGESQLRDDIILPLHKLEPLSSSEDDEEDT